jgi:tetratricopeptide (TPR) repeat protein
MADYAEVADPKLRTALQQPTLNELRLRMPNMRGALEWCFTRGDAVVGARLAMSLGWFWALEGDNAEAIGWLTKALDEPQVDATTRARLLELNGIHTNVRGDVGSAQRLLTEAVDLWAQLDAEHMSVLALMYLGITHRWTGDLERAAAAQDRAIELARAAGDDWSLAWALLWRAGTAGDQADESSAAELLNESRARAESAADPCILGWIIKDQCDAALRRGETDRGLALINEAIGILEPTGWTEGLAAALTAIGRALLAEGRPDEALLHHRRALRTATELGQPYGIAEALEGAAEALAAVDELVSAVELLGAATAVRSRMGAAKRAWHRGRDLDAFGAVLRRSVGTGAYDQAFERGRRTSPTEVVAGFDSP